MKTKVPDRVSLGAPGSVAAAGRTASITAEIATHAAATPDRAAVVDGGIRLSFAELESRSNRLARLLRETGAGPECCVGLLLERSAEFVVAALASLKAGAAYLPMDSSTPADRAGFILADSAATVLVTHRGRARGLRPGPWEVVELDGPGAARVAAWPDTPVAAGAPPEGLAYVIYTSGSTGGPKGVEVTLANLRNLVDWHRAAFRVTPADRASQVAGLGFDAAAWEIWPHLTAGASLHIADEMTRLSPLALRDWLVAEGITIGFVPTILAEPLLHATWPPGAALRTLLTGAEELHRRPAVGLPFVVVNNYGPTECTVVATSGVVSPEVAGGAPISIGRPIANTTALVLDEALRRVPDGEVGELCLAGAGVGRGYRNNPGLTADRFVTYAPDSGPPLRVYRTGDRARVLGDGEIAFLGRLDDQVKVRGHRVEPGEIVTWLDRYPGVEASAVVAREADGCGGAASRDPVLVAYLVAAPGARLTAAGLRGFLAGRLPEYMVPARYVSVPALPVTANGKLDRSALPAPAAGNLLATGVAVDTAPGVAAPAIEPRVAAMIASLLGQPSIDREDNLFMVGGHSMLGAQLVTKIWDTFRVRLTLRQLFNAPTVATLSAEVARLAEAAKAGP